jgi:hypothetical protein
MNLIINPQFEKNLCPLLSEEHDAACDEAQEAWAEADHAKANQVRMARDVAIMFDELRAVADKHAELHTDRARLQADVDRLAAELEQARRRLMGSSSPSFRKVSMRRMLMINLMEPAITDGKSFCSCAFF